MTYRVRIPNSFAWYQPYYTSSKLEPPFPTHTSLGLTGFVETAYLHPLGPCLERAELQGVEVRPCCFWLSKSTSAFEIRVLLSYLTLKMLLWSSLWALSTLMNTKLARVSGSGASAWGCKMSVTLVCNSHVSTWLVRAQARMKPMLSLYFTHCHIL